MGKTFKRFAGDALNLNHDLFPAPDEARFVRTFFFDRNGAALVPAFVNLNDNGGGRFSNTSIAMQSTPLMKARHQVYLDSGYSELDCEYPGDTDCYELDNLLPTQLPGAPELEAEISNVELEAEITEGTLEAEVESGEAEAEIDSSLVLEAEVESQEVDAETTTTQLEGEID